MIHLSDTLFPMPFVYPRRHRGPYPPTPVLGSSVNLFPQFYRGHLHYASQGVGLRVLMRLMGHRNVSTTAVYIDANDVMLRRAVELV